MAKQRFLRTVLLLLVGFTLGLTYHRHDKPPSAGNSGKQEQAVSLRRHPSETPPSKTRADFLGVQSPTSPLWKVRPGFDVEMVAAGFTYPVNLAFANAAGEAADSPRFYVSELHGAVKYVANDGLVHVYAEGLTNVEPQEEFFSDETGLVGLTTIPESEDLIVTVCYQDSDSGLLSNKILRLVSEPGGRSVREIHTVLDLQEPTSKSHQIQSVRVGPDGKLYVAVGDGHDWRRGMNRERFGGKILRVNLDGTACKDNPYYEKHVRTTPSHYVYAYGLRNVFDFDFDPRTGRIYGSDNGPTVDRFIEIVRGAAYGYTGSNDSMRTNALYTWGPKNNPGPAGFVILKNNALGENSAGRAYLAMASNPAVLCGQSIWECRIDPSNGLLSEQPRPVVNYVGEAKTTVVGLAEGPDGLYFTDFFGESRGVGNESGKGNIWKLVPSPETLPLLPTLAANDAGLSQLERGMMLFEKHCRVCHAIGGRGGREGPMLDGVAKTLQKQLNGPQYEGHVRKLLNSSKSYFVEQRDRLASVLAASGKARVRTWLVHHIAEPRFDNPYSKMPSFGHALSPSQRDAVITFLLDSHRTGDVVKLDEVSIETLDQLEMAGFGVPEGPFPSQNVPRRARWMTSNTAEVTVCVAPTDNGKRSLRLRLRSLADEQIVRVRINGRLIGTLRPGRDWLVWKSKPVALEKGQNVLHFEANAYKQPSGDKRRLYVLLDELSLAPSDESGIRSARSRTKMRR